MPADTGGGSRLAPLMQSDAEQVQFHNVLLSPGSIFSHAFSFGRKQFTEVICPKQYEFNNNKNHRVGLQL